MRLAVLFPGAGSFHEGMCRELYEQSGAVREVVREHDRRTGTPLADALWYRGPASPVLDAAGRAAAVLTLAVGCYEVYRERYRVPGHVFAGQDVGYLAALVAAGGLELADSLRVVRGERVRGAWFRRIAREVHLVGGAGPARDAAAMAAAARAAQSVPAEVEAGACVDLIAAVRADTVLETGPGDLLTAAIGPALPEGVIAAAFDTHRNAHVALDNLNVGKYYNPAFLAGRVLGHVAGTRDRVGTAESRAGVAELVRRLKQLGKAAEESPATVPNPTGEEIAVIRGLARCWVENGLLKGHAPAEIDASLRRLEAECLLPVRRLGGISEHTYAAHAIGGHRRAA